MRNFHPNKLSVCLLAAVMAIGSNTAIAANSSGNITYTAAQGTKQMSGPGFNLVNAAPVSIAEADRVMRTRSVTVDTVKGPTKNSKVAAVSAMGVDIPAGPMSIPELARALKKDPDLIYEYVRNNIEYYPVWGVQKGAFGALLDKQGTAFDQAALMVALLRESGYTASFVKGVIKLNATQAKDWLGVDTGNVCAVSNLLGGGQIPNILSAVTATSCPSSTPVALSQMNTDHIWVKVNIGGTNYYFDPSYKPHSLKTGINLNTAIGASYTVDNYMTSARTGATINADYVQNLNRNNIRNNLTTYSSNVISYLRNNLPAAALEDVVGGKTITPYSGGALRQTSLSYQDTSYGVTEWTDIPTQYKPTLRIQYQGIDTTLASDAIYGKRLSITYNASNQPVLMLDGVVQATGTATTLGTTSAATFTITHNAYTSTGYNQSFNQNIKAGGTHVIGNNWGPASRGLVEQYRRTMLDAKTAGNTDSSEPVLGSNLSLLYADWVAQNTQSLFIIDRLANTTSLLHHQVGLAGYNQSAYINMPGNFYSNVSQSADSNAETKAFFASGMNGSALESASVQQSTGASSISSAKLIDLASSSGDRIYDAKSSNYATNIKPLLDASCTTATKDMFGNFVNAGYRLTLPARCNIGESGATWKGYAFYALSSANFGSFIYGDLLGGETSNTVTTSAFSSAASNVAKNDRSSLVDKISGAFTQSESDITVGTGDFPLSLGFQKSYSSSLRNQDGPLGKGWSHNFAVSVQQGSDGFQAMGEDSALDAVGSIVATKVTLDLLSDTAKPLDKLVTATLGVRWYGDQLVNNTVVVSQGLSNEVFVKLADGTYNAPPGNPSKLILNGDGTYSYDTVNHAKLNFNSSGKLANYQHPVGIQTNLSYTGNDLTGVSNSLGRSLTITNTSGRISNVSDGTRSVSYSYDGNGNLTQTTDVMGKNTTYQYDQPGRMTKLFYPAAPTTAVVTNAYDTLGRVQTQTDINGKVYTYYLAGSRAEEVAPGNIRNVSYFNALGRVTKAINPLGRTVTNTYDAHGRVLTTTLPEGNSVSYAYDDAPCAAQKRCTHNVKTVTQIAKPGSGLANRVTSSTYESSFNKVASVTDPLGKVTSYTYTSQGLPNTVTYPTDSNGVSPVTTYGYSSYTPTGWPRFYLQTSVTNKTSATANVVTSTTYDANNKYVPATSVVDSGTGLLNLTSSYTYDAIGNLTKVDGPRTDVTDIVSYTYDNARRVKQTTNALGKISRQYYDDNGRVTWTSVQKDSALNQWMVTCNSYTASGKLLKTWGPTLMSGDYCPTAAAPMSITDYAYDDLDRLIRVTENLTTAEGGNRVSETVYNNDGSVQIEKRAVGSTVAQNYATYAYTTNGLVSTITDAKGNRTTYEYDGHDRKVKTRYPDKVTANTSSTTDYEQYSYDANGNLTTLRKRDGSTITNAYDNLNRATSRSYSANSADNVNYTYDLLGRRLTNNFANGTYNISYEWDNAGRLTKTTAGGKAVSYSYNPAGQRTRITWPETTNGLYVTYDYDALGRPTAIKENGATSLASYTYDEMSRRTNVTLGNGTTLYYGYDNQSNLSTLSHNLEGAAVTKDVSFNYTRNQVQDITNVSWNNDIYQWTGYNNSTKSYTSNGLNQYTAAAGSNLGYDGNGNLTGDGVWTYAYDSENRLKSASKTGITANLSYDPTGRLVKTAITTASAVLTNMLYDASDLIAEYDASGNVLRRYVHGPGTDDPLVWYEGTGTTNKSYFHADHLGSIIATTNSAGTSTATYTYGPYGEPNTTTGSRFRYTGQTLIGELNLYYYKARFYSPALGRFLQTDPIGYGDGLNMYAYVGNDSINNGDPTGLCPMCLAFIPPAAEAIGGLAISSATRSAIMSGMSTIGASIAPRVVTSGLPFSTALQASVISPLAARANQLASLLPQIVRDRFITISTMSTTQGATMVTRSGPTGVTSPNSLSLSESILNALRPGEIGVPGRTGSHAEMTNFAASIQKALTPVAVAASKPICMSCFSGLSGTSVMAASPIKGMPVMPPVAMTTASMSSMLSNPVANALSFAGVGTMLSSMGF